MAGGIIIVKTCTNKIINIFILCIVFLLVSGIYFAYSCYALEGTDGETSVTAEQLTDLGGPDLIERTSTQGNFGLQSYGINIPGNAIFKSSDENVASVDSGGYVHIHSAGETLITISGDGIAEKRVTFRLSKGKIQKLQLKYIRGYGTNLYEPTTISVPENSGYFRVYNHFDEACTISVFADGVTADYEILDPEIMNMDEDGIISFNGLGEGRLKITTRENDLYLSGSYYVKISSVKYDYSLWLEQDNVKAKMSQQGFQIKANCTPSSVNLVYRITNPSNGIITVDDKGYVTFLKAGEAAVLVTAPETDKYVEKKAVVKFVITEDRIAQEIKGDAPSETEFGKDVTLDMSASTDISFSSSDKTLAIVDADGLIHFLRPGTVRITVAAEPTSEYQGASRVLTITARDYKAEAAAESAKVAAAQAAKARAAADQAQANKLAKKLKKPKLKVKRQKRKNKLSWKKVKGASGYVLYVKYPGTRKYVRAVTKGANIKSVTHKGLTRKKTYKYKLRAYVKVGNAISYGPYSKVASGKVK